MSVNKYNQTLNQTGPVPEKHSIKESGKGMPTRHRESGKSYQLQVTVLHLDAY